MDRPSRGARGARSDRRLRLRLSGRFSLEGHRGARGLYPENTLAGFAGAIALGVHAIEVDVAVTADDIAVVIHDPVLNADLARTPGGAWLEPPLPPVRSLRLAELQRYDVGRARPGSLIARAFPEQRACDGAVVPTLAAMFAAAGPRVRIEAELKTDARAPDLTVSPAAMAELVVAQARACDALDRLAVRSFDWRGLRHLQATRPGLPLVWLTHDSDAAALAAVAAAARPGDTWAPDYRVLSLAEVDEAHARGLLVVPWTVNVPADMARLIAWGVDGLCTDRPDRARTTMAAAGLALPEPG